MKKATRLSAMITAALMLGGALSGCNTVSGLLQDTENASRFFRNITEEWRLEIEANDSRFTEDNNGIGSYEESHLQRRLADLERNAR